MTLRFPSIVPGCRGWSCVLQQRDGDASHAVTDHSIMYTCVRERDEVPSHLH